ncbi:coenzyme Q biosynthesis Coq4 [Meredithblackwellia eburnea MCA 4105]
MSFRRPSASLLPRASSSAPRARLRCFTNQAPAYPLHVPVNAFQRTLLAAGSAVMSLYDTSRHDMVAVLSETTAGPFMPGLRRKMLDTPSGRAILRDRPRITEESLDLEKMRKMEKGTFGRAYVDWLARNKVTPDTRDPVSLSCLLHKCFQSLGFSSLHCGKGLNILRSLLKVRYMDDPELAYIMQRYRESHDFYHVLLGFGVSLPAELVVKWFELANFNLPVAFLSSVFGPLRMETGARHRLMETYGTWALKCGGSAQCLIGVYWEKEWEKDINVLRDELGIYRPPMPFKEWRARERQMKGVEEPPAAAPVP